jgi:hypothetical protein
MKPHTFSRPSLVLNLPCGPFVGTKGTFFGLVKMMGKRLFAAIPESTIYFSLPGFSAKPLGHRGCPKKLAQASASTASLYPYI